MNGIIIPVIIAIPTIIIGFIIGYVFRRTLSEGKLNNATLKANEIVDLAQKEAITKQKEAIIEAKEQIQKMKEKMHEEITKEQRDRKSEWGQVEKRLHDKEDMLDKKQNTLDAREETIHKQEVIASDLAEKTKKLHDEQLIKLQEISGVTVEKAKEYLLNNVEQEIRQETAVLIREIKEKAKEEADKEAKEIVMRAIQRCATDHVAEATVYVVSLPNDEMKGRIIGREGRNIRTIETLTGVDLIIDDTPEAVVLSGFDPVRREIARITLEKLITDGRIHPGRIEETYEKAKLEVEKEIKEAGEQALLEVGISRIHPELVKLIGRLKYRTSYGQNILKHSLEVAHLSANLAYDLGADPDIARRAGLLHDIGKGVDHEIEGTHVEIGVNLLHKYKENSAVIHAVEAHHEDVEAQTMEAVIVQIADSLSAARPGARRETLESYIKRLQKLEEIADGFEGVEKSYAIQAGREVRIMVKPDAIDDLEAINLTRSIVKEIESEMDYPGQIKVMVIRETRSIEYAK
ncbi:MAG: ribonuclease Y [Firmicutes bacterium]|nr:ribonuclease Y [Bacillota bacterium]